jgi:hypothetical protein
MNTPTTPVMRLALTGLLLATAGSMAGEPPVTEVAPIRAAALLSFHCEARVLPTQRAVGEALGQYNFSQVYDSRARLMSEVGRACQRRGVERVDVVQQPMAAPRHDVRHLAMQTASGR